MALKLKPRIAIPMPHSGDPEYAERSMPQYENAVRLAGGEPVRIALELASQEAMKIIQNCDGVVLPGSSADVDPDRFGAERSAHTAAADARREAMDRLLLDDAYKSQKPVLGICYGLQSLNVYRGGSLIQHIPDSLPEELRARVNHEAGKKVAVAHDVEVAEGSRLGSIMVQNSHSILPVNSSHHQSVERIGDGLRIVGRCVEDGIVEALEGTTPGHFLIAVQWHPERSVELDEPSRAIFLALVEAANKKKNSMSA